MKEKLFVNKIKDVNREARVGEECKQTNSAHKSGLNNFMVVASATGCGDRILYQTKTDEALLKI